MYHAGIYTQNATIHACNKYVACLYDYGLLQRKVEAVFPGSDCVNNALIEFMTNQ